MSDNIFADGLYYEAPSEKAPSWIKGKISINVVEFIPFLEKHRNNGGYVNLDIKEAKSGKIYVALNEYKKGTLKDPTRKMTEDEVAASVPPIDLESEPNSRVVKPRYAEEAPVSLEAEPEPPVDDIPF